MVTIGGTNLVRFIKWASDEHFHGGRVGNGPFGGYGGGDAFGVRGAADRVTIQHWSTADGGLSGR
jgi:hypothetical protein